MTQSPALDTLCRLMPSDLPQTINPQRLAKAETSLSGQLNIDQMQRLLALIESNQGLVNFELEFSRDDQGNTVIRGSVETTLDMLCQRCFKSMSFDLSGNISLQVVATIEASRECPDQFEPLLLEQDEVRLDELVEDEILLALPLSPLHDTPECHAEEAGNESAVKKENPFSVLKKLKQ